MPLRHLGEFHAWIARESPTIAARRVVRTFIAEIGDEPWTAPSVPIADLSSQPEYEVRTASLPVANEDDVHVWYLHDYATGDVDLIAVNGPLRIGAPTPSSRRRARALDGSRERRSSSTTTCRPSWCRHLSTQVATLEDLEQGRPRSPRSTRFST